MAPESLDREHLPPLFSLSGTMVLWFRDGTMAPESLGCEREPSPALQLVRHQGGSDGTMAPESLAGSLPPPLLLFMLLRHHGFAVPWHQRV